MTTIKRDEPMLTIVSRGTVLDGRVLVGSVPALEVPLWDSGARLPRELPVHVVPEGVEIDAGVIVPSTQIYPLISLLMRALENRSLLKGGAQ